MFEKLKKVLSTLRGSIGDPKEEHIPRGRIESAIDLLSEVEREVLEKELTLALQALDKLDENRKFFYLMGKLYVEVSKEEARQLIEEELKTLKNQWR